jgi:NAD:arginine ADP-ribosyltransferase
MDKMEFQDPLEISAEIQRAMDALRRSGTLRDTDSFNLATDTVLRPALDSLLQVSELSNREQLLSAREKLIDRRASSSASKAAQAPKKATAAAASPKSAGAASTPVAASPPPSSAAQGEAQGDLRRRLVDAEAALTSDASPLYGLRDLPVPPDLGSAIEPMMPEFKDYAYTFHDPDAPRRDWTRQMARQAKNSERSMKIKFSESYPHGTTLAEVALAHMYTVEGPFYHLLNDLLRSENRARTRCAFPVVRLFLSLCEKLPKVKVELYRGVNVALAELRPLGFYTVGSEVTMWAVTSGAQDLSVIKSFLGENVEQDRVQITLKCRHGVDIAPFSAHGYETECILVPGSLFEVTQAATLVDRVTDPDGKTVYGEFSQVIMAEVSDSFGEMLT